MIVCSAKIISNALKWQLNQSTLKTVKHGGASIMMWGCFSYSGVGSIYHIPGIMDQFEQI